MPSAAKAYSSTISVVAVIRYLQHSVAANWPGALKVSLNAAAVLADAKGGVYNAQNH
jgi:hypothetical protein